MSARTELFIAVLRAAFPRPGATTEEAQSRVIASCIFIGGRIPYRAPSMRRYLRIGSFMVLRVSPLVQSSSGLYGSVHKLDLSLEAYKKPIQIISLGCDRVTTSRHQSRGYILYSWLNFLNSLHRQHCIKDITRVQFWYHWRMGNHSQIWLVQEGTQRHT